MNVVGYMFVLRIHEMGCEKCYVWLSCCVLAIFFENWSKEENYNFEWYHGVIMMN